MSLDVYLTIEGVQNFDSEPKIFIRENGQTKEISREEWDKRYPNREPVTTTLSNDSSDVFSRNITHNLGEMAAKAGVYEACWRPEEKGWKLAKDIIPVLEFGLANLEGDPTFYKQFNPENGWGDYDGLVNFVSSYLEACKQYPEAIITVSR